MARPTVVVEFDANQGALILQGPIDELTRHPLFAAYIRQAGGRHSSSGQLLIPLSANTLASRYRSLCTVLARLGADADTGNAASQALRDVEAEEQAFQDFAKRASDIWHRNIDTEEFRAFVRIVQQQCAGRTLYRRQLLSAFHLAFAQNACNFSVPGAGKTSVVYAAYAYLKNLPETDKRRVDRLLIVGPLSSFKAWHDEYREVFARAPTVKRIYGASSAIDRAEYLRGIQYLVRDVELTLTSYQTLATSEDDFRAFLERSRRRVLMVLDEAHYIKRDDGVWASAALRLAPLAGARIALTGTPAPNGYEDLANVFRFIYPERNIIGFSSNALRTMTTTPRTDAVTKLKANLRPFFTRIRKSDLGLPAVHEHRVPVSLDAKHERIYRAIERRIVPELRALAPGAATLRLRGRLMRLRQACVNPELLRRPLEDEGLFDTGAGDDFSMAELEVSDLIRSFDSPSELRRLSVAATLVKQIIREQGKVLVWSYFLGNVERLRHALTEEASFVGVLTGATPVADLESEGEALLETREAIIDRFHRPDETALLIANPQAVGESISLHKACRSAIYFDRDFNAGRYIQSKDRIHRYHPTNRQAVTYYHLVCDGSVDSDIDERLEAKEARLADLIDSDDIPLMTAGSDTDDVDDIRTIIDSYERRKVI